MFISKYEKEAIQASIKMLQAEVKGINEHIENLAKHIITKDALPVKKRQWNEASKRALSESMKKSWAARKAKRAAMAQNKIDETKV